MATLAVECTHMSEFWGAGLLRLTAFIGEQAEGAPTGWWESVTGGPPEHEETRRLLATYHYDGSILVGGSASGILNLDVSPGRVDWVLVKDVEPQQLESLQSSALGPLVPTIDGFQAALSSWFRLAGYSVNRLALGAQLRGPSVGKIEGYRALGTFLPDVKIDTEGSSDFLYRINRPRPSLVLQDGTPINRLSLWSVGTLSISRLRIDGGGLTNDKTVFPEETACSLELDINTSRTRSTAIPGGILADLLTELRSLLVEIAESGDRP